MNRDPDERRPPDGVPRGDGRDGEGIDTAGFESIVAGWRREGGVPVWPDDRQGTASLFEPRPAREHPPVPDDEHFVPPEPPPLPPIGPPAVVGLVLLGLGLLLLISPGWLGVSDSYGLPLGLVGVAAGLGWLVLRLWPDPPEDDLDSRPDDGAVL